MNTLGNNLFSRTDFLRTGSWFSLTSRSRTNQLPSSLRQGARAGFSLLEVIISLAIIVIIVSILLVQYEAFNSEVLLRSQAYEMALSIREAQVQAVSVLGARADFRQEHGIYITRATPDRYQFFVDSDTADPVVYDAGEEVGAPLYLDARYQISRICINNNNCGTEVSELTVYFDRPDFDAYFTTRDYSGSITNAEIHITPVLGASASERVVAISSTGQITVQ